MHRIRCLRVVILASAIMAAAMVASASARSFSTSSQTLRATWREAIFTDPFGSRITCPLTLEGTFHAATLSKVPYTLIGNITEAAIGPRAQCGGGEATLLRETLPWNIRYQGFEGRLPDITRTSLLVANASFRVFDQPAGATCLLTSRETTREHIKGIFTREAGGAITEVETGGEITSNENCAFGLRVLGRVSGRSTSLTRLSSTTRITMTLI